MVGKKVVSVVLLMVLALTAIPLNGFAEPVNKAIAGDPAAVSAAIEAMNLPDMPDEVAAQLRGEGWFELLVSIAKYQGIKWITHYALNSIAEKYGWPVRFSWFKPIDALSY